MQTRLGAIRARQTMVARYGSEEGYRGFMESIGARGGKASSTGGFATRALRDGSCDLDYMFGLAHRKAQCSGYKGGINSKRTKQGAV